jgi:hypothetical protein
VPDVEIDVAPLQAEYLAHAHARRCEQPVGGLPARATHGTEQHSQFIDGQDSFFHAADAGRSCGASDCGLVPDVFAIFQRHLEHPKGQIEGGRAQGFRPRPPLQVGEHPFDGRPRQVSDDGPNDWQDVTDARAVVVQELGRRLRGATSVNHSFSTSPVLRLLVTM